MNTPLTLSEFDPELNPIGYALASELHGDDAENAIDEAQGDDNVEVDRFGWEYTAA